MEMYGISFREMSFQKVLTIVTKMQVVYLRFVIKSL